MPEVFKEALRQMADYEARCRGETLPQTAGDTSKAVTGGEDGCGAEEKGDAGASWHVEGERGVGEWEKGVENGGHRTEGAPVEEAANRDGEVVLGGAEARPKTCVLMEPPTMFPKEAVDFISPRVRKPAWVSGSYWRSQDALDKQPHKSSFDTLMV